MNKLIILCGILIIAANAAKADYDSYNYRYIKAFPETMYTNGFFKKVRSGSATDTLGDPFYIETISFTENGSLPNGLTNSYIPPIDQGNEEDSDGVTHTWSFSDYSIVGTISQLAAQQGHDNEYNLNEIIHTQSRHWTNNQWSAWSHTYQTNFYNYYFRIDDWADSHSETSHVCKLSFSDNYTNGFIQPSITWYLDGNDLTTPSSKTRTISADVDCFSVPRLQAFILDVVSSNFEVNVNGNFGFQWTGNYLSTNFGSFMGDYEFTVSANNSATGGNYFVRARIPKPLILIHGIRSHPIDNNDTNKFCNDLDIILEDLGYNIKFLAYDSSKPEPNIETVVANLKDLIETMYLNSGSQQVCIITHSFGTIIADLCAAQYKRAKLFQDKVDKLITLGGPHRGAPAATIWKDPIFNWLGEFFAKTAEPYKDAPELGSAYNQKIDDYIFPRTYALNGKWGTVPKNYYENHIRRIYIPRNDSWHYTELNRTMENVSDGFIPHYCAAPTDFANRRLIYSDSSKGMSHDVKNSSLLHTEPHVTKANKDDHATFIAITNILAGGNINDTGDTVTYENKSGVGLGVTCKEFDIVGTNKIWNVNIYTTQNGTNKLLWTEDKDNDAFNTPEKPYSILVGANGQHKVFARVEYLKHSYSNNLINGIIGIIPWNRITVTSTTGTINIIEGKVIIENNKETLSF